MNGNISRTLRTPARLGWRSPPIGALLAQPADGAGCERLLQGQDHPPDGRLRARRRLRRLWTARGRAYPPAHPRQSDRHRAEHAGRRLAGARQLSLQRRAEGRHRVRRGQCAAGDRPADVSRAGQVRSAQFRWLGSALKENHVGLAWHTSPVQSFDDLFSKELIVAGTGGATNLYPVLTNGILGTKIKMIPGYQGTKQGMLAMERGEVGGNIGITWASLKATTGAWLREKQDQGDRPVRAGEAPRTAGRAVDLRLRQDRPTIAPRWTCRSATRNSAGRSSRRRACPTTCGDPAHGVRADHERSRNSRPTPRSAQVDLDFTSGADIQALIEKFYKTPPAIVERIKTILDHTAQ